MKQLAVLRIRKNVPGIGRKVARHFNAQEVVCGHNPTDRLADNTVVFNYGRSKVPVWAEGARARGVTILNKPSAVARSVDKITCLGILSENGVPALIHTTNRDSALAWLEQGDDICIRHTTTGKQGQGVEVFTVQDGLDGKELPRAPLYTQVYNKTHEFRVHVFKGEVIDLVQKKRMGKKKLARFGLDEADTFLRNHKKGYVFAHNDLICDSPAIQHGEDVILDNGRVFIEDISKQAVAAIGLDYCGVDVLAKYDRNGAFVSALICETNSAPSLRLTKTFNAYAEAIDGLLRAG